MDGRDNNYQDRDRDQHHLPHTQRRASGNSDSSDGTRQAAKQKAAAMASVSTDPKEQHVLDTQKQQKTLKKGGVAGHKKSHDSTDSNGSKKKKKDSSPQNKTTLKKSGQRTDSNSDEQDKLPSNGIKSQQLQQNEQCVQDTASVVKLTESETVAFSVQSSDILGTQEIQSIGTKKAHSKSISGDLQVRKILDDRYIILKTIGHGRYAKVKLGIDTRTNKNVAVKILKARAGVSVPYDKYTALDGFYTEIEILAECNHPNVVKIKAASFDGTLVKELIKPAGADEEGTGKQVTRSLQKLMGTNCSNSDSSDTQQVLKRKTKVCYYVMKLAEYGELYRLVDMNERLSEDLIRHFFSQLMEGLLYLHSHGFVHRDIKPENLLVDRKFRLIIADFNFATRLHRVKHAKQTTSLMDYKVYSPFVQKNVVGSEAFNAPELCTEDQGGPPYYDGIKADIFSAAVTLFLVTAKFQPFRRATLKDPYYKRLTKEKTKSSFWKIFNQCQTSSSFKDIFERMTQHDPNQRPNLLELINEHSFLKKEGDYIRRLANQEKIVTEAVQVCENISQVMTDADLNQPPANIVDDVSTQHKSELDTGEDEQLEKVRQSLIEDVRQLNVRLQAELNVKKISRMAMKNMIAQPNEYMQGLKKDSLHVTSRPRYGDDLDSHRAMASSDQNMNRAKSKEQGTTGPYHSEEERSGNSNNSSTLARYSRRARRTSSCHGYRESGVDDSFEEEEE